MNLNYTGIASQMFSAPGTLSQWQCTPFKFVCMELPVKVAVLTLR